MFEIERLKAKLNSIDTLRLNGKVQRAVGIVIESKGPSCKVGELCQIRSLDMQSEILAEVVGFRDAQTLLMPLGERNGIEPGSEVVALGKELRVRVGEDALTLSVGGSEYPLSEIREVLE